MTERLLIVGNSGSGKSTLAGRLARHTSGPVLDLDLIHWHDNGSKRDEALARRMLAAVAAGPAWIVEGVYGWLAEAALPRATALIWTDLSPADCRSGLLRRGFRRGMTEADQTALLSWADAYWTRNTPSSASGHQRLFDGFRGGKARLTTRAEADAFAARFPAGIPDRPSLKALATGQHCCIVPR